MAETTKTMFLWIVCVVLTFSRSYATGTERCPRNLPRNNLLRTYGEKCYQFVKTEMYWQDARNYCQRRQGDLIMIKSREIQGMVEKAMYELWSNNGMWIGAEDRRNEGQWKWADGDPIGYSNWDRNQPSCFLPKFMCVEDCAVIRKDERYRWHDYHCRASPYKYGFACEFNMLKLPTTKATSTLPTTKSTTTTTTTTTTTIPTTKKIIIKPTLRTPKPPIEIVKTSPTSATTSKSLLNTSNRPVEVTNASISVVMNPGNLMNMESQRLSKEESGIKTGGLVGLIISFIVVFLAGLILGVVMCRRRYRKKYLEEASYGFNNVLYTAAPRHPVNDRVKETNVMVAAAAGEADDDDDNGYSSIEEVQACAKKVNLPTAKDIEESQNCGETSDRLYETIPQEPHEGGASQCMGGTLDDEIPPPYPGCNFTGFQPEFLKKETDVSQAYSNNLYGYKG